jgi:hypothetical protein
MAFLTAGDDGLPAITRTKPSTVCTIEKVDNYLGYTAGILNVCVRIAGLRAGNLSTPAYAHELFDM